LVVAATLSQYLGLKSVGALDRIVLGVLEFGAMLAFAIALWVRMQAAKPALATGSSAWGRAEPSFGMRASSLSADAVWGAGPLPRGAQPPIWPADPTAPGGPTVPRGRGSERYPPMPAPPPESPTMPASGRGGVPGQPGQPGQQMPGQQMPPQAPGASAGQAPRPGEWRGERPGMGAVWPQAPDGGRGGR
jgi:hypothetical protein